MNRRTFIRASFAPFIGRALSILPKSSPVVTTIYENLESVRTAPVLSSRSFRVPLSYAPALSASEITRLERERYLSAIPSLFEADDHLYKKLQGSNKL